MIKARAIRDAIRAGLLADCGQLTKAQLPDELKCRGTYGLIQAQARMMRRAEDLAERAGLGLAERAVLSARLPGRRRRLRRARHASRWWWATVMMLIRTRSRRAPASWHTRPQVGRPGRRWPRLPGRARLMPVADGRSVLDLVAAVFDDPSLSPLDSLARRAQRPAFHGRLVDAIRAQARRLSTTKAIGRSPIPLSEYERCWRWATLMTLRRCRRGGGWLE